MMRQQKYTHLKINWSMTSSQYKPMRVRKRARDTVPSCNISTAYKTQYYKQKQPNEDTECLKTINLVDVKHYSILILDKTKLTFSWITGCLRLSAVGCFV